MKTLLVLILICCNIELHAQTKNNTHIDQANTVNIYKGNVSIGQIIINETPGSKVFLTSFSQSIDTAKNHLGQYKTVFNLVGENGVVMNKVITLLFDKPVISCDIKMPHGGTAQDNTQNNAEQTIFRFIIGQLASQDFQFEIYSKEKIFTKIDGLSGKLP